jgi:hypothetical protein
MALPELYRYGREGHWYNNKLFLVYMFDGVVQVSFLRDSPWVPANLVQSAILYFLILYAYRLTTARSDGFDVALYEFSTVRVLLCCLLFAHLFPVQTMVIATVVVANLFNGLCTNVWTAWVFFAVVIGIIVVLVYTVSFTRLSCSILSDLFSGCLFYPSPWVDCNVDIRQWPFPFPFAILLVQHHPYGASLARTTLSLEGVQIYRCPRWHRCVALGPQG